ncbi:MAG: LUD domain-containing protein [Ignavibacteria bacterium]|nr:LUD domain-containing protein [Ignavibacteria bacterium]
MKIKDSRDSIFSVVNSSSKNLLDAEFNLLIPQIHSDSQVKDKVDKFKFEAEQVGIEIYETSEERISNLLHKFLSDNQLNKVGIDSRLKNILTSEILINIDIKQVSTKSELKDFDTFIELCEIACCDTATLFLVDSRYDSHFQSLLPENHIVVLNKKNIFSYQNCFEKLNAFVDKSQNIVAITGPSRTADIEKVLVKGVHGPKKLIVFLID